MRFRSRTICRTRFSFHYLPSRRSQPTGKSWTQIERRSRPLGLSDGQPFRSGHQKAGCRVEAEVIKRFLATKTRSCRVSYHARSRRAETGLSPNSKPPIGSANAPKVSWRLIPDDPEQASYLMYHYPDRRRERVQRQGGRERQSRQESESGRYIGLANLEAGVQQDFRRRHPGSSVFHACARRGVSAAPHRQNLSLAAARLII